MGFFGRLFRAMFGGLRLSDKEALHGDSLNHVLTSAMYAAQQSAYLNAYTTGLPAAHIRELLETAWEIDDRVSALATLEHLLIKNDDPYSVHLFAAYEQQEAYVDILKKGIPTTHISAYVERYRQLLRILPEFIDQGYLTLSAVKQYADAGWNIGRAAFLARCCYDSAYMTEVELKSYLARCYLLLKTYCHTWEDYTKSYVYGRALWGGNNNAGMISIAQELFTNRKSPLQGLADKRL